MADENTSNNPPEDNTEPANGNTEQNNPVNNALAPEQPATATPPNAFNSPEFDTSEITRKLDGIIETQAILSKAVAELIGKGGNANNVNPGPDAGESSRPTDVYGSKPIDAINNLKL